jgi:hypothetical protein
LTCDALISDQTPGHVVSYANRDALAITVLVNSGTVPPGPYNANGTYETTTATCGNGPAYQSTDGSSFMLTQLSATEVAGSFSMNFGTQGSLSGSFDLPICNVPDAGSQTSGADAGVTCTP